MYLDKAKARFNELPGAGVQQLRPCTQSEVEQMERQLGLSFPPAYREFLLWMGHDAGEMLAGSNYRWHELPTLREWAVELLSGNNFPQALPEDAVVFLMHQGYQFMFFRASEGSDPAVYYYNEVTHKDAFTLFSPKFSEFLLGFIESFANPTEE